MWAEVWAEARKRENNSNPATYVDRFKPDPWQAPVLQDKSFIILLTGSAGGGKSRMAGQLIHRFLRQHKGATGLALRKAREFANKSLVPFLRYKVVEGDAEYLKGEHTFMYPNGSMLYIGGMKDDSQRESIRSIGQDGALDIVWIEEANAFTEDDFNELLGRMRGKATDYTQIILSTNPDAPNHWINKRLILGKEASAYYSSALDNPHNPKEYIDNLNRLTGVLRKRLVEGQWIQAEGVIYDNFDPAFNVTTEAEYNPDWEVYWGVDEGYALGQGVGYASYHPRVIVLCQITPMGGLNVFAEYVVAQELHETTLDNVLAWPYKEPLLAHVDSSAQILIRTIQERGITTFGATHRVSEGIKNVRRLICDGNGVRLLKIHPRVHHLPLEMQSYRYDANSKYVEVGEPKPLQMDDHSVSALRYIAWKLRYENNF